MLETAAKLSVLRMASMRKETPTLTGCPYPKRVLGDDLLVSKKPGKRDKRDQDEFQSGRDGVRMDDIAPLN